MTGVRNIQMALYGFIRHRRTHSLTHGLTCARTLSRRFDGYRRFALQPGEALTLPVSAARGTNAF